MIIVLNGYPGVSKLTIGRELANVMQGRLLDIHTVYNLAFALTEFKSPEFMATVERVEAIAHDLIHKLPSQVPVVLPTVLAGDDDWGACRVGGGLWHWGRRGRPYACFVWRARWTITCVAFSRPSGI